ncbi:MAG TPA: hypothetical protein VHS96_09955, partial [Bacteroidia bacterium]|nr:hypothetical protein [Bacteroidia bacterium]
MNQPFVRDPNSSIAHRVQIDRRFRKDVNGLFAMMDSMNPINQDLAANVAVGLGILQDIGEADRWKPLCWDRRRA